jgi:hypothetical protein
VTRGINAIFAQRLLAALVARPSTLLVDVFATVVAMFDLHMLLIRTADGVV